MRRGRIVRWCAWPLLGLTTTVWAKDELPKTEPFAHYEPMLKRSPFAIATADSPVAGKPDFAKDLYVANAAHSTDGDYVTIGSTVDKNLKEYLNTKETINGFSISNIQWSDRVGETKVTIAKEGAFATLTFNEALLSQAIQNPVPQMPQPVIGRPPINGRQPGNVDMPAQQPAQPQIIRPMPVPLIPTPPPHVRSTIRRRANQPAVQPQVQQPDAGVSDDIDDSDLTRP